MCTCVCVCSQWAEDRATGEFPLNYTQVVINYRWHFGHINDFILKWGLRAPAAEVRQANVCVNKCVCMCITKRHHLWLCSQLSTNTHTLSRVRCVCCWLWRPHPAHGRALMNILIMLTRASCPGFPVPPGKVNSRRLHSTARACGHTGARWWC